MNKDFTKLISLIERIELLQKEKNNIGDDIKNVYNEVKAAGYNVKAVKEIIKMRKKNDSVRAEEEFQIQCYKDALGMN